MNHKALYRLTLTCLGAVLLHGSSFAGGLSVCIDKSSPTAKLDRSIASAIAQTENQTLDVYAFDSSDDDDGMGARDFDRLLAHHCSFVMGYPADLSGAPLPSELAVSKPYGRTGYVLATAKALSAKSLADLPDGTEVAVTDGTITDLILTEHQKLKPDIFGSEPATLKALASGVVKAALVWRPIIDSATAAKLYLHPLNAPHTSWNLTALYASENAATATAFNAALDRLSTSGALASTLSAFSIEQASTAERKADPPPAAPIAASGASASANDPPALYTQAQATRGMGQFMANCAQCHGADLHGVMGPALTGPHFATPADAYTVHNVFAIVSQNMPAMKPGSLTHDVYRDIMAFLLQQNGYPAGSTELQYNAAMTSTVLFVYHGK